MTPGVDDWPIVCRSRRDQRLAVSIISVLGGCHYPLHRYVHPTSPCEVSVHDALQYLRALRSNLGAPTLLENIYMLKSSLVFLT